MKLVVSNKKDILRINRFVEFVLYAVGYTAVFLLLSTFFDSFHISSDYKIIYAFIAICIIYVLNQAVKPILVTITMPITGLTFGLFYFVINTFILKLTDWIMGSKLDFTDIWILFFIAILLSAVNFVIEQLIIKPIIKKVRRDE